LFADTFKKMTHHMSTKMQQPQATAAKDQSDAESWDIGSSISSNGMVQTLAIMTVVSVIGWSVPVSPLQTPPLALSMPLLEPWWALLTAGYSHINTAHFAANATMIIVFGGLVSLSTSAFRFHAFFLSSGVITSAAQVSAAAAFGSPLAVLGASGSAFALMAYVLVANPVGDGIFSILSRRGVLLVSILIGGGLTIYFSSPGSALVSHFVGAIIGVVAGRLHLLATE
jgi:membrane associated rhomboid family serine protease